MGIYGHSQGGLIAPLAAVRSSHVAFIIAGASYGGPVFEQDLHRVSKSLESSDLSAEDRVKAMAFYPWIPGWTGIFTGLWRKGLHFFFLKLL